LSILNPLRSIAACEAFAASLSKTLQSKYATKLKPIKLCHAIAQSLLGEETTWNSLRPKIESLEDVKSSHSNLTPMGINSAVIGSSGSGKSNLLNGYIISNDPSHLHKRKVVIDIGRSYEKLCDLEFASFHKISKVHDLYNKSGSANYSNIKPEHVAVFELEDVVFEKCFAETLGMLKSYLELYLKDDVEIIVDETHNIPSEFLHWLLCEIPNKVTLTFQSLSDLTRLTNMNLFNGQLIEIKGSRLR
jgi:hypothetical protein